MKTEDLSNSRKDQRKKTCWYYGKEIYVENTCCGKSIDLEEKVKKLEEDVTNVWSSSRSVNDFTFIVKTSQSLLVETSQNEWVVDSSCTHHMAKDASLLSYLDAAAENKIYVANEFSPNIVGHGDITCWYGQIVDMYHVHSLGANLLYVSQLTQIGKIVEF